MKIKRAAETALFLSSFNVAITNVTQLCISIIIYYVEDVKLD